MDGGLSEKVLVILEKRFTKSMGGGSVTPFFFTVLLRKIGNNLAGGLAIADFVPRRSATELSVNSTSNLKPADYIL